MAPRPGSTEESRDELGDPEVVARIICLRLLDHRARTRAELEAALSRRGVPEQSATIVLDRFAEVGLIDDVAYAARFASARHNERGLARRAISMQLRQRGVDSGIIEGALDEIDTESEVARAQTLVQARLRRLSGLDRAVQARRLTAMLARKGYPPGLAGDVVRRALAEASDAEYPGDSD
jgi:regulatory protein